MLARHPDGRGGGAAAPARLLRGLPGSLRCARLLPPDGAARLAAARAWPPEGSSSDDSDDSDGDDDDNGDNGDDADDGEGDVLMRGARRA